MVVRSALDVLTPSMPERMEDGNVGNASLLLRMFTLIHPNSPYADDARSLDEEDHHGRWTHPLSTRTHIVSSSVAHVTFIQRVCLPRVLLYHVTGE